MKSEADIEVENFLYASLCMPPPVPKPGDEIQLWPVVAGLPPEISHYFPETATVYDGAADGSQARVLTIREPGGPWLGGILQISVEFCLMPECDQKQILLHELAHLLTSASGSPQSQPRGSANVVSHDQFWLQIYALLMARGGFDIRNFEGEIDYLSTFGITVDDVDEAMEEANWIWPKINPDVFTAKLDEVVKQRQTWARAGWRKQWWTGVGIGVATVAAVATAGAAVISMGSR